MAVTGIFLRGGAYNEVSPTDNEVSPIDNELSPIDTSTEGTDYYYYYKVGVQV